MELTTNINLRHYQHAAIEVIRNKFTTGHRQLFCLPTGGGKTIIFNEIARAAAAKGKKVLILTDRLELLSQTEKKSPVPCSVIDSKTKVIDSLFTNLFIGMIRSVINRFEMLPKFDLVIIDEAHRGDFNALLAIFEKSNPNLFVLGVTATPVSTRKNVLINHYHQFTNGVTIQELIKNGFLCKPRYFAIDSVDLGNVKIKAGEYDEDQMFDAYNQTDIYDGLIENYMAIAHGKKTIVFCINIKHTILTYEAFKAQKLPAFLVHSGLTKDEREYNLTAFKNSPDGIMVNCGILTTGYDEPAIEVVILNRSTTSLALYMQMCGRGSRPYTDKDVFIILDMGFNIANLGDWDQNVNWSAHFSGKLLKDPKQKEKEKLKIAAEKREFDIREKLLAFSIAVERIDSAKKKAELVDLLSLQTLSETLQDIIIKQKTGNKTREYKAWWVANKIMEYDNYEELLNEFAKYMGYKSGWVKFTIEKLLAS